jgi:UDP-glucose 4-epimerase
MKTMSKKNTVLVVGGAGYIGSHMVGLLQDQGLELLVLDDLSSGFADAVSGSDLIVGDIGDAALLDSIFTAHSIDAVMHFASFIQVGESVVNPAKYYENNVAKTLVLLAAMAQHKVKSFIFSSAAAIFGNPISPTIDEKHPQNPINPYGRSKWMIEQLLQDYEIAYGLRSVCLRYFNAAGAQPDSSLGERHEPETHLIPLTIKAALGQGGALKVFGTDHSTPDGTCVRDYVHVCDLAGAHQLALEHLRAGGVSLRLNLGNESGYSVKQVLACVGEVVGKAVPYDLVSRRAGDPAVLVANSALARSTLGWRPQYPALGDIVAHAAAWHAKH